MNFCIDKLVSLFRNVGSKYVKAQGEVMYVTHVCFSELVFFQKVDV